MIITTKPKTFFVILEILKILIQNQVKVSEYYIRTCQGKDARHRVSTNMEIMKILIQNYLQEIFLKNIHLPQNTSGTHEGCPYPNTMRAAAYCLNQVKADEYYIGTCQGKDARHRVSTNP